LAEDANYSEVRPLQTAWPQAQSMSGVFSMAAHSVLQYLPEVTVQVQTGCAHFSAFGFGICFLLAWNQKLATQGGMLEGKGFRRNKESFRG
jgi:hypothetical protein